VSKDEQESKTGNKSIVLDTNILVSAFLTPEGIPAQIVNLAWQGKLQACYNQSMLDEYSEVLARPNS
jgi:putative PIN family toxin of toxin-antitoxin system